MHSPAALSKSFSQSPAKKRGPGRPRKNVDARPESQPRSRNSSRKLANRIIPASVNAPITEHVPLQTEAMRYLSDDYMENKCFCVQVCDQFEIIVDILHSLMQDSRVRRNPPARSTWLKSITAVPAEKLPLRMLCFLYCSPCTTDEKLVAHCSAFVNQEQFSLEYLMTVPESQIIEFLNPLGIQNDQALGLKRLANQIYFQFNQKVPDNISDLRKIKGVGPKIAILTLSYGFGKKHEVSYFSLYFPISALSNIL